MLHIMYHKLKHSNRQEHNRYACRRMHTIRVHRLAFRMYSAYLHCMGTYQGVRDTGDEKPLEQSWTSQTSPGHCQSAARQSCRERRYETPPQHHPSTSASKTSRLTRYLENRESSFWPVSNQSTGIQSQ